MDKSKENQNIISSREIFGKGLYFHFCEKDTLFYRQNVRTSENLDQNRIFEVLEKHKKLKLQKNILDGSGHQIFHLVDSKTKTVRFLKTKLGASETKIYDSWPNFIKKNKNVFKNCKNCAEFDSLVDIMIKKNYNIELCRDTCEYEIFDDDFIKNRLKIRHPDTGRYRKLHPAQIDRFKIDQDCLQVLSHHKQSILKCRPFWHDLVVEDNIPQRTVIVVLDHQGKKHVGSSYRLKTNQKNQPKNIKHLIPFGVVFQYADRNGKTKRISRYFVPDTVSLTTHQVAFMVSKLFNDENDVQVRNLLLNCDKMIVIFFPQILKINFFFQ